MTGFLRRSHPTTSETLAPGSNDAATSCSFSAGGQRRRRSTDMITAVEAIMRILRSRFQRAGRHVASEPTLYGGNNGAEDGSCLGTATLVEP
jgi:hypothetical protein